MGEVKSPLSPSKEPFAIDEDIELGDLQDTLNSPKSVHLEQYEDDFGGDDGSTALLGAEGRTRGMERLEGWRQLTSIVLEVMCPFT